jgi:NitT/TauT family transport system substrate-binding protein
MRKHAQKRPGQVGAVAVLLGICAVVAVPSAQAQTVGKLTPASINLSWVPTTANQMPFYLAKKRGFDTAVGLDIALISGRGSAQTTQALAAGQYDVAQADLTTMALLNGKGASIKAFFVQFPRTSFGCVGAKDANITTWKDMEGKKIGMTQGSPETYLLPATFKKLGLAFDKLQLINLPASNKNTSFISKLVDGLCTDVAGAMPLLDAQRPLNPLWFGDELAVPYHGLFSRNETIKAKPDVLRKIAGVLTRATKAMIDDPKVVDEAAQAQAQVNAPGSIDMASLVAAWKLYARFQTSPSTRGLPLGAMSRTDWARTLEVIREYAAFSGSTNPDDYFTNDFVQN